jgi:hypothetical protein
MIWLRKEVLLQGLKHRRIELMVRIKPAGILLLKMLEFLIPNAKILAVNFVIQLMEIEIERE